MRFQCSPVDAAFFESAPLQFRYTTQLEASAAKVFAIFKDPQSWPQWFGGIRKVHWHSAEPFGVGTLRTVTLDTMTVQEHFFRWEEGRRFSFYFANASIPVFSAFAEDYLLEDAGAGRCRFTYTIGVGLTLPFKLLKPVLRMVLGKSFTGGNAGLVRYVANRVRNAA